MTSQLAVWWLHCQGPGVTGSVGSVPALIGCDSDCVCVCLAGCESDCVCGLQAVRVTVCVCLAGCVIDCVCDSDCVCGLQAVTVTVCVTCRL